MLGFGCRKPHPCTMHLFLSSPRPRPSYWARERGEDSVLPRERAPRPPITHQPGQRCPGAAAPPLAPAQGPSHAHRFVGRASFSNLSWRLGRIFSVSSSRFRSVCDSKAASVANSLLLWHTIRFWTEARALSTAGATLIFRLAFTMRGLMEVASIKANCGRTRLVASQQIGSGSALSKATSGPR